MSDSDYSLLKEICFIGYDKLFDDGNVNMYKIKYNDTEKDILYNKYF